MKRWLKHTLIGFGVFVFLGAASAGGYAYTRVSAFEESMAKVYDVKPLPIERSADPQVLARGKHLVESLAGCAMSDCHGRDLGGGKAVEAGPLGVFAAPNITGAGFGAAYSDGELARLIRHGVKKDGRSLTFMPAHEINWLPDSDLTAIVSYVRTVPDVQKASGSVQLGVLAKILDRRDEMVIDVARRIQHDNVEIGPPPSPTAEYGRFIARLCTGCHGPTFSGGPLPGAPPSMPVPTNITPHETGLKGWTFADFEKVITTGVRKDGSKLDPFMPVEGLSKLDDTEKQALWAHLQQLEPKPFGNR